MVLPFWVWTPTPDRCRQRLADRSGRKGRVGWFLFDKAAFDQLEAPLPALQHRGVDLAVRRAAGRRGFPGGAAQSRGEGDDDDLPRIPEARDHAVVERRDDLVTSCALPTVLFE